MVSQHTPIRGPACAGSSGAILAQARSAVMAIQAQQGQRALAEPYKQAVQACAQLSVVRRAFAQSELCGCRRGARTLLRGANWPYAPAQFWWRAHGLGHVERRFEDASGLGELAACTGKTLASSP